MFITVVATFAFFPQPVNLDIRGKRLESVATQIGAAIGVPSLTISNILKDDVIVIRSRNVEQTEFRTRLLKTLNATLVKKDNSWMIEQTPAQAAADQKRHRELLFKRLEAMVSTLRSQLAVEKPFSEADALQMKSEIESLAKFSITEDSKTVADFSRRVGAIDKRGPMVRFTNCVLASLTPNDWVNLSDTTPVVVLSTKPTKLQYQLNKDLSSQIYTAVAGQSIWASVAPGDTLRGPNAVGGGWYGLGTTNEMRRRLTADDFAIVTVKLDKTNSTVEATVYDRKNLKLASSSLSIPSTSSLDPNLQEEYNKYLKIRTTLSGPLEEFLVRYNDEKPKGQIGPFGPLSPELKQRLLDPVAFDPLEAQAEVVLKCTAQPNIIAVIDDRLIGSRRFSAEYAQLSRNKDDSVTVEPNWVTYRPLDIVVARRDRSDRAKLRQLARKVEESKGNMSIEDRADFAYSLPWEASGASFYNNYLKVLNPSQSYGSFADQTLRVYGAMTKSERDAMSKGVAISKLSSAAQLELLRLLLFRGGAESYSEQFGFDGTNQEAAQEYVDLRQRGT
ncbi:MAG TPA: hypothetical protein VK171_03840, partial [Fimbriimonas sp.]|nr:hypothetical protein [Fimbriimonas sp.]